MDDTLVIDVVVQPAPVIEVVAGLSAGAAFLPLTGGSLAGPGHLTVSGDYRQLQSNDTSWSPMGSPALLVTSNQRNSIVGYLYGNAPPGTMEYPAAVSGFAKLAAGSQGNQAFGIYGLAELHATSGSVFAGEFTVRNLSGAPDVNVPPDQSFGTGYRVPTALQVTSSGTFDSAIGLRIGSEIRDAGPFFNTAQYIDRFRLWGLIIESQPTGTQYNIYSRNNGAGVNLRLQTTTAMQPNNTVFTIEDVAGLTHFNIRQNGDVFANNGYKPGGGTWADVSDARTKEDILDYQTGLASVRQLRPVSFKHNGKGGTVADNRTFVGLLAHEAQLVMPEMVSVTAAKLDPDDAAPTELLSLDATALLYALVNAVQELATKMDAVDVPA